MRNTFFFLSVMLPWWSMAGGQDVGSHAWSLLKEKGKGNSSYLKGGVGDRAVEVHSTEPDLEGFKRIVLPVVKSSCINCHGPKKSKGGFRVDELSGDLVSGPHINEWLDVYEVLSNGEMPPEDKPKYAIENSARGDMIEWIGLEMKKASEARKHEAGHSSFRRMTKYEYNYALQDLLGLPYDFAATLPPESVSEDGFKNSSQLLQMSAMQFESYRKSGLSALKKATVRGEQPKPVNFVLSMEELALKTQEEERKRMAEEARKAAENGGKVVKKKVKKKKKGPQLSIFNHKLKKNIKAENWGWRRDVENLDMPPPSSNVYVLPGTRALKLNMENHLPDEGVMRIRVRVSRSTSGANQYSSLQIGISAKTSNNANFAAVISDRNMQVTATPTTPELIEFRIPLAEIPRNPLKNEKGEGRMVNEFINLRHVSNAGKKGPKLYIDYIDITGPHYEQWPPSSHRKVFPDIPVIEEDAKAKETLVRFMTKAWRRPVSSKEVENFMGLYARYRPQFLNMEEAMLEVMAAVLASPEFLYINYGKKGVKGGEKKPISDLELASRLSFFLWSSLPDTELVNLAKENKLSDSKTLNAQIQRMLSDERAKRFSQNFVEQWLGLEGIEHISVHRSHGPYSPTLKAASVHEPIAHFNEVLFNNLSVLDFIQSDYLMLNETLARHYGISGVYGPHFRRVELKSHKERGGLMTTAGVMTVNSDGKDSHPLKRGVWVLERFLNDPPPPPPPNVPEVDLTDPRILKMTLKERMADHRKSPACFSCHAKIDPWGIALENYDALGRFRTEIKGKKVDARSELYNKQKLEGALGLKRYLLLDRQDQFVRAMVHKMASYALGRHLSFKDRQAIDALAAKLRKKDDRLRDLVALIINSDLFMMN